MRRLEPYVLREMLGPTGLGFLVYTFILLTDFLYKSAEMIIRRGVPAEQVGRLVLLTLPNIVVLTIPMSLLFGILVAVGRLSSDHELVAMRASGVSLFRLYRPTVLLALVFTVLNTVLMVDLLPRGNSALQQLRLDILTGSVARQVEPRVFYEEWEGLVLYVSEIPPGEEDQWRGVFLAESLPSDRNQVTVAERGGVRLDEGGDKLILRLENAVTHEVDFKNPIKYERYRYRTIERVVDESFSRQQMLRGTSTKGLRELTIPELRERVTSDAPQQLRNLARVEIQKKFSIPVACLVFGLLGLPLGFTNLRGGRSSGFVLSIAVVMVYWILINNGEEMAGLGRVQPWLAMWLPNLLLAAVALVMMWRKNRDRSLIPGFFDRWLRNRRRPDWLKPRSEAGRPRGSAAGPVAAAVDGRPDFVVRLPRLRLRFPNLIDRYVIRVFVGVFALVMMSGVVIFVVADMSQKADAILQNQVGAGLLFDYYKYLVLQVCHDIAPMTILVTTLISFGILSRTNELVAAKALGISLYRFSLPAVVVALGVVAMSALLQMTILPATNEKVQQLKDEIKGRQTVRSYRRADRQWLFGQGRYIYNYLNYDGDAQRLHRLQVFEFDESFRLSRRLFAATADYQGDSWLFNQAWVRSFEGPDRMTYEAFPEPVRDDYPETPDYFESEFKPPQAMSYGELKEYLREIRGSGQSAPELDVALYRKVAYPFVSLVMALVALPFSFRLGRRGALYGVGIGVFLGMIFFALYALFTTLGETGALPPAVAVWSPSGIFALASIYLLLGVRT